MPEEEPDRTIATKACDLLFGKRSDHRAYVPEHELRLADPDRLARYFRMMSLENVPEVRVLHELLRNPARLEEALSQDDPAELIFLLEWIDNYLPSCAKPDVAESCRVIAERACALKAASKFTRELCDVFAKVLVRLIRKAALNLKNRCFTLAMTAPLSVAEKVLLDAAAEQGKWVIRPEMARTPELQLVSDSGMVDATITRWSERVRQAITDGTLLDEPRFHSILYRLAQLNFAYRETYDLIEQICANDEGLMRFLDLFEEDDIYDRADNYALIEDPHALANRIRRSALINEYEWLAKKLIEPERSRVIQEQAASLLQLKPHKTSTSTHSSKKSL
nr:hypothetical protein [uncultured Massilia sp.]